MRIKCKQPVALAHIEVQLWRLRWWGWEQVGKPGLFENARGGRTFDTWAEFRPAPSDCYYYQSTGEGYVIDNFGQRQNAPGLGRNYDPRLLKSLPPGCGSTWK